MGPINNISSRPWTRGEGRDSRNAHATPAVIWSTFAERCGNPWVSDNHLQMVGVFKNDVITGGYHIIRIFVPVIMLVYYI